MSELMDASAFESKHEEESGSELLCPNCNDYSPENYHDFAEAYHEYRKSVEVCENCKFLQRTKYSGCATTYTCSKRIISFLFPNQVSSDYVNKFSCNQFEEKQDE